MRKVFCWMWLLLVLTGCATNDDFWTQAEPVQTGTLFRRIDRTEPRLMKICAMRIDLSTPGLVFTGTGRDVDWGKPMPDFPSLNIATLRVRTRDFLLTAREAGENMIVAFNSAPWHPWKRPFHHRYGQPRGVMILDGEVVAENKREGAEFIVWKDGRVEIAEDVKPEDYANVKVAAAGFALLMRNGETLPGSNYEKGLMPRIAYGLSRDRRYLYIVTVDGRQPEWSLGVTGPEITEILREAGAYDAIDMDGGGSATLCYWDEKTKEPIVVTHHKDAVERLVGANIGIILVPERHF